MRILIIEDEVRAANQLRRMLTDCGLGYQLLDVLDTVEDSVTWFQNNAAPELVFMDIQLADGLSFEIFQKVDVEAPIIFTTAFDHYAIQAFKVNSVDYLLKPIQTDDLNNALKKFNRSNSQVPLEPSILKQLLGSIQGAAKREGILVKEGNGFLQIPTSELDYCYSEDSITFGVTQGKRYIINESMDELFESLDQNRFFRINRGQIVSKTAVRKLEPYFNHRVKLTLHHPRDQEFVVSRSKTNDFKDWMNR